MYLLVVFFLLSGSLVGRVASQPNSNLKVDQNQLAFTGCFPFQSRNLTIRNLDNEHPVLNVSLDRTDLLENASDKTISKDQINFSSQQVKDFNDFQIPAGGKITITVSIEASNLTFELWQSNTYTGTVFVITNSTELTVPIIVYVKPPGILGTIGDALVALNEVSGGLTLILTILGATGVVGFISFYRDSVNFHQKAIEFNQGQIQYAQKQEDRERDRIDRNKNKLNIDLKYRIVKSGKEANFKRYLVISPSMENVGTNDVRFDFPPGTGGKQIAREEAAKEGQGMVQRSAPADGHRDETWLSVKALTDGLSFKDANGKPIMWDGKSAVGDNDFLRRGEKLPPTEKFVEFTGDGIFEISLTVENKVNGTAKVGDDGQVEQVIWRAAVYGSTFEEEKK